jgi:hypothetical protein
MDPASVILYKTSLMSETSSCSIAAEYDYVKQGLQNVPFLRRTNVTLSTDNGVSHSSIEFVVYFKDFRQDKQLVITYERGLSKAPRQMSSGYAITQVAQLSDHALFLPSNKKPQNILYSINVRYGYW